MTAAIERGLHCDDNYDADGFLHICVHGHQPNLGEPYISTVSTYLASFVFPTLGLSPSDLFWSEPDQAWTAKTVWALGQDMPADRALYAAPRLI